MSEWIFDLTDVPRGRIEERINAKGNPYRVFIQTTVWAANKDGKVYMTHWEPKDPKEPSVGRWMGWSEGDEPAAWMPFVKPVHPGLSDDETKAKRAKALDELGELDGELLA